MDSRTRRLKRVEQQLDAGQDEKHRNATSADGKDWEELNAEAMIRSYRGDLNHCRMLRDAGLYWEGSPESHQRAVAEAIENLEAQKWRLASWRVFSTCTREQIERIAAGEDPVEVVPNWPDRLAAAHQAREDGS